MPQSTPERINQFASLQSSRQEKREKFQKDDTWQRGACAFPSLCISFKVILTTSLGIRREVFYFLKSCLTTEATRNEDRPNPCEVNSNRARRSQYAKVYGATRKIVKRYFIF